MITDRGASECLHPSDLPEDAFSADTHLHLTGYLFSGGTRRETAKKALRLARESGMSVSVDPSSAPLLEDLGPERFLAWTSEAEVCFPNLAEGAILAGTTDPDEIAEHLLASYGAVVLKLGAEGALYAGRGGERHRLPAARVRVVDTTGAGDALCAGFLSGEAPESALELGVKLAGEVVSGMGGACSPKTRR